ncbi:MAG: hypothetical protein QE274_17225, partial [Verrucomicrobiaceae bacterium]|nr:hypothetical protein [Verrucomicrobiaceae bacterium]
MLLNVAVKCPTVSTPGVCPTSGNTNPSKEPIKTGTKGFNRKFAVKDKPGCIRKLSLGNSAKAKVTPVPAMLFTVHPSKTYTVLGVAVIEYGNPTFLIELGKKPALTPPNAGSLTPTLK